MGSIKELIQFYKYLEKQTTSIEEDSFVELVAKPYVANRINELKGEKEK